MSDVLKNDDLNALAAEYVLGTLDHEERIGASSMLEVDHAFRGLVRIWERRFGELHLMVEPVAPDAPVWERVKARVAGESPSAIFAPEKPSTEPAPAADPPAGEATVEAPPVAPAAPSTETVAEAPSIAPAADAGSAAAEPAAAEPAPAPPISPTANLIRELEEASKLVEAAQPPPAVTPQRPIEREAVVSDKPIDKPIERTPRPQRRWRLLAVAMSVIALALASLIGTWRFAPEWLPPQLSATSLLHLPEPESPPLPPPRKPPPPDFDE
jgi:hypothetical protein